MGGIMICRCRMVNKELVDFWGILVKEMSYYVGVL